MPPRALSPLPLISLASALVVFAALQALAWRATGGVFEYPLDDVYIHLAMAEQIAGGGYGVNAGEYASAASSPLYPLLLLPLGGLEVQRFLPLIWNIVGLGLSAFLWGGLLAEAGFGAERLKPAGYIAALFGPLAVIMSSTSVLGMEHSLHTAASLAILLGLLRFSQSGRVGLLLYAGLFLAPLLRLEGLALALLASGALMVSGARKPAAIGAGLAVLPVALFAGFLVSLGLDPLPSSVEAKLVGAADANLSLPRRLLGTLSINLGKAGGAYLAVLTLTVLALARVLPGGQNAKRWRLAVVLAAAGAAHLVFGQIGWLDRYEHYILTILTAGALVLVALSDVPRRVAVAIVVILMIVPTLLYTPRAVRLLPLAARAIHTQQQQLSRFAKDHLNAPVAVNDLGWVSWGNPHYVLDLWGLASAEARMARLNDPQPGWADTLTRRHDISTALIYDEWLSEAAGEDWVALGGLTLKQPRGFLGSARVMFYATSPAQVPQVKAAIEAWIPTLDARTYFEWARAFR